MPARPQPATIRDISHHGCRIDVPGAPIEIGGTALLEVPGVGRSAGQMWLWTHGRTAGVRFERALLGSATAIALGLEQPKPAEVAARVCYRGPLGGNPAALVQAPGGRLFLTLAARVQTAASAWSKSAIRSSASSMPIETRTRLSVMPSAGLALVGDRQVGHRRGVAGERLGAAEADRELGDLQRVEEAERLGLAALDEQARRCCPAPVQWRS